MAARKLSARAGPGTQPAETKAGRIADALRELIATGHIDHGVRLYQDELAAQFKASITPVREALRQLQAEGLLVGEPHRGVRVASPNVDEIGSIYVMRRLVEPYAACRASKRLSRLEYDRARRVNEEFGETPDDSPQVARSLNHEFHFIFYNSCGLPTLVSEIERLWTGFPWAALQVRRGRKTASYDEHKAILEAIVADDQEAIRALVGSHLQHGFETLMSHIGVTLLSDPFEDGEDGYDGDNDGATWWRL
ncbi:MAG: hypothetical protein QOI62_1905 [Solirubrobacteraceae bacterium]|nr:hypothetical protein [Solirubrobacteraceae bacterium]MEA2358645.1 hypothetical protein [Solirubrobacteraceae bacterium]